MKTLDILIPTYLRPKSACAAILSALVSKDERFNVVCSSNLHEPILEELAAVRDSRFYYYFQNVNQGFNFNLEFLFSKSAARYCLLLSDEDRIDPEYLTSFLDFLDELPGNVSFVYAYVWCAEKLGYYYSARNRLVKRTLTGRDFATLDLVPTYMSGFVFSKQHLMATNYSILLTQIVGNSYPHLDLAQKLLIGAQMRYFPERCVLKGRDIMYGGDGYSHLVGLSASSSGTPTLNPKVYGAYARSLQFFYRLNFYRRAKIEVGVYAYTLRCFSLLIQYVGAVVSSPKISVIPVGSTVSTESRRAFADWQKSGVAIKTLERLFIFLVCQANFSRYIVLKPLKIFVSVARKLYFWVIVLRNNTNSR